MIGTLSSMELSSFSLVKYEIGASIPNWLFLKSKCIWTYSDTCLLDKWPCLSLVRDLLSSDFTKCVLCSCEERCLWVGFGETWILVLTEQLKCSSAQMQTPTSSIQIDKISLLSFCKHILQTHLNIS